MVTKPPHSLNLSANLGQALDERLAQLRIQITDRAEAIAKSDADPLVAAPVTVDISCLAAAIDEVTHGRNFVPERKPRFFELFPPFTCVCAVLCVIFAALGLAPVLIQKASGLTSSAQSFLDLAKIFAGAIVGSTSVALSSAKRR